MIGTTFITRFPHTGFKIKIIYLQNLNVLLRSLCYKQKLPLVSSISKACCHTTLARQNILKNGLKSAVRQKTLEAKCSTAPNSAGQRNSDSAGTVESVDMENVQEIVTSLMDLTSQRDKMVMSLPAAHVAKQVINLLNMGFQKADIVRLHRQPEVVKNLSTVAECVNLLMKYGCTRNDITNIVKKYPEIALLSEERILLSIQQLQNIGFSVKSIADMISTNPQILGSDLQKANGRVEELKELFKTTDVFTLIERSSELLFIDMQEILQRFNYVYCEMGITQRQMMYSRLFSYPMDHIHARHMFLVRAGLFKKLKKKEGQINRNPRLDQILDTSDEKFAKMFGNMTVQDYETFKKLLKKDVMHVSNTEDLDDDED